MTGAPSAPLARSGHVVTRSKPHRTTGRPDRGAAERQGVCTTDAAVAAPGSRSGGCWSLRLLGLLAPALGLVGCASGNERIRTFPDRPVAWLEHDDTDLPQAPKRRRLEDEDWGLLIRDTFTRQADRALSFELPRSADDVNALDEVPCSTWFCPRNHLDPMTPAAIAAGPAWSAPPELPLTITGGK